MTGTEQSTSAPRSPGWAEPAQQMGSRPDTCCGRHAATWRQVEEKARTQNEDDHLRRRSLARRRVALRVAAGLATELDARLVAVHVLDRVADIEASAERTAANLLYDEIPDIAAEARGEVGDVAAGLGRARRGRHDDRARRSQPRALAQLPQGPLRR